MDVVLNTITQFAVELIVIIVGTLLSLALNKVKTYFNILKKKDELGIIDKVTDIVVELVESELKGVAGDKKRNYAVDKAVKILGEKGIKVSRDEIIAGIENGVNKLNK